MAPSKLPSTIYAGASCLQSPHLPLPDTFTDSSDPLRFGEAEFEQIFNTAADGMRIIDLDHNIICINETFCRMFEIRREDGLGRKCYDVFRGQECHSAQCSLDIILSGKHRIEREVVRQTGSGRQVDCILTATPLFAANGRLIGIVEDFKDITTLKDTARRLRLAQQDLEHQVEQRTRQLQTANTSLEAALAEHKATWQKLKIANRQRRRLAKHQIDVQETERKRLAYELHDVMGHALTGIKLNLETLAQRRLPKSARKKLAELIVLVQETMLQAHQITTHLRPPLLDDLGIDATISWFSRQFRDRFPWIFIQSRIDIEEEQISADIKLAIFRIIQEALTNAAKHSQGDQVTLTLEQTESGLQLCIADNGIGFDLEANHEDESNEKIDQRLGVFSMSDRAELTGGSFHLESAPQQGARIDVLWPDKLLMSGA